MLNPTDNLSTLVALRTTQMNHLALNQALNRLATGRRINSASDDPAGLIASVSMDATLAVLDAESTANERAINVADTADGALGQISDMLGQAKSLVVANANDAGLSPEEKQANQLEIDSIMSSVNRIASDTNFNGQNLLDGSGFVAASGQKLSISSADTDHLGKTTIDSSNYSLSDLGSGKSLESTNGAHSQNASRVIDQAINDVSTAQAKIGAFSKNTLQRRITQIASSRENLLQTVSIIRDADYAAESSRRIRAELLNTVSTKLLSYARHSRRGVFDFLA
jgi:flagellin